jgi:putative ABC transport system substrate-binding protein
MRELGHIEGQNIAFEYRSAEGNPDRLAQLAAELVSLKVDCIVTAGDVLSGIPEIDSSSRLFP